MIGVRRDEKRVSNQHHHQREKTKNVVVICCRNSTIGTATSTTATVSLSTTSSTEITSSSSCTMSSSIAMPTPSSSHPGQAGGAGHNKNNKYRSSSYNNVPQYSYHGGGPADNSGGTGQQQQQGKRRNHGNTWNWPKKQASAKSSIETVKSTPKDFVADKNKGKTMSSPPETPAAAAITTASPAQFPPPQLGDRKVVAEEPVPVESVAHRSPDQTKTPSPSRRSPAPIDRKDGPSPETTTALQTGAAVTAANHYSNELLKLIRDNRNVKDNAHLWAILNNIAGPLIIKNQPAKNTAGVRSGEGVIGGGGFDESALLQAMEQSLVQNQLVNAIISNGGLLPSYFPDPLTFYPPPPIGVPLNGHGDTYQGKVSSVAGSPTQQSNRGAAYHPQQEQVNYQRMPPPSSSSEGSQNGQRHHSSYSPPFQQNNNSHYQQHGPSSPNSAYYVNGPIYCPRPPKNFWNFCVNCKKSQYCPIHPKNYNSSASALYTNAHGNFIAVPNSFYVPDYYQQQRSYPNPSYGHYHHHHHHYNNNGNNYHNHRGDRRNHHGGGGGGGGGRRQYNNGGYNHNKQHQGQYNDRGGGSNKSCKSPASNGGGSSTSGSCPASPKTASPVSSEVDAVATNESTIDQSVSSSPVKDNNSSPATVPSKNNNQKNDPKRNDRSKSSSGNNNGKGDREQSVNRSLQGSGMKRWQGHGGNNHQYQQYRPRNNSGGGYESDTSSSRSNGTEHNYVQRYNYGLLQNMKLWNQEGSHRREQLLAGDLGPHQLMSPTNYHRFNEACPLLRTVIEGHCGGDAASDGGGRVGGERGKGSGHVTPTTTQPVILQEEQESESAYWSSVFPFATAAGSLEEGVPSWTEDTPADKYLANAHLVEMVETPKELMEGMSRDTLSQQIWNTFLTVQQTQATYKKKIMIWKMLYACIKKVFPRLSVYLVGSTITGFGAETSDVDMCVVSSGETELDPRVEAVLNLTDLKKFLSVSNAFEEFHLIQAKVPILRFRDTDNRIEVDLNYNNCVGIRNTQLLYCYSKLDWRVRPLVLVVKLWAKFHDINNAKNMTISSYSLALMVIHFLQCGVSPSVLPCLHTMYPGKFQNNGDVHEIDMNEELDAFESQNNLSLGELLLRFLFYYSNFDFNNLAISVRAGSCLYIEDCRYVRSPKNDPQQWKNLCIEEPFDFTNTARSVYDAEIFHKIKYVFVQSYQQLHQTLDLKSILNKKFVSFPVNHCGYGPGAGGGSQQGRGNEMGEM